MPESPFRPHPDGGGVIGACPALLGAGGRSGWVGLDWIAAQTGIPLRTVRKQARRLPDSARDKRAGTVNQHFALPEWRAKLAGLGEVAERFDPATWRPGDVRRHSEITHILNEWQAYYSSRRLVKPDIAEAEADADFCRRYGAGHFFGRTLKPGTLQDWRARHRNGGVFRETRGRKRRSCSNAIGAEARARFLSQFLSSGVGITLAYQTTAGEANRHPGDPLWSFPSESTVRRWIRREWPEFYTAPCRKGWQRWRADCQPKLIRDEHKLPGNELWEADGTTADYFVRCNGRKVRPTVINVVDVATHMVVGWAVGRSESQEVIIKALRRAITQWGAPLRIRTDLGKAFLGEAVGDAKGRRMDVDVVGLFEQLGVTLEPTMGRSPWHKPGTESVFNAFGQRYAPLHGRAFIGNNTKTRVEGVDRWADSHLDQLKTIEEDDQLVGEFFAAENRRPRRDRGGVSPLQKFEATAIPKRTVPVELLDYLFARALRTRVTNRGIPVTFGQARIWYGGGDHRVWELIGREVVIRVSDDAPAWIWLCDKRGQAMFKVVNDEVRGHTGAELREAGKRQAKARKRVRDRWQDTDVAAAHPIDECLRLQREYAEAQAAKVAKKMPARKRGKTVIVAPAIADAKVIKREELRAAAGAEGMTSPGPTLSEVFSGDDATGYVDMPDIEAVFDGPDQQDQPYVDPLHLLSEDRQ